jgi:tetratricopeptide (TPR) repeat protein
LGAAFPALAAAQQSDITRYKQEAQQTLAKNDLEGARQGLEQLAQLTPQVAEVFGNLGVVYYSRNRFGQAAEALERALHLNPKLPNAELMLGVCDAELGRNEDAVRILEPVFRSPPDAERGRLVGLELQRPYALLGEHAKADAVAEEMIRRYPDDPEILYDAAGPYTERIYELLKRLVDVAPGSVWLHLAFAQSHESAKRYDAAIEDYRNALRLNRQLRGVHFNLGRDLL